MFITPGIFKIHYDCLIQTVMCQAKINLGSFSLNVVIFFYILYFRNDIFRNDIFRNDTMTSGG